MSINQIIPIGNNELDNATIQTVNARDLHAFLEVGRDFSNWIKSRIAQYGFEEGVDYALTLAKTGERQNVVMTEYHISLGMGKELAMVERNDKGREVRKYFIECERQAKGDIKPIPKNYAEALRSLATEVEQKAIVEAERDEALRTKAEIGARHEATAMATASAAMRKAQRLEEELGLATNWKTAKAIPWVKEFFKPTRVFWSQFGKTLAQLSLEKGCGVRKVEDEHYGKVNAYHVDVIESLRRRIETDPHMLERYRLQEVVA